MTDLWQYLQTVKRPILLYGSGNGADKILSVLTRIGVAVQDIFASDGFVRSRSFHGVRVISYDEAIRRYGSDVVILLAFGSDRPEVMKRFFELSRKHELYAPDVPIVGDTLFDWPFFSENTEALGTVRSLLADELSRKTFDTIVQCRLSGKIHDLPAIMADREQTLTELLHPEGFRIALDLGAYTGDTAAELLRLAPGIRTVIAVEPDLRNFTRLSAAAEADPRIEPHLAAAWDSEQTLRFRKGGGRAIRLSTEEKSVETPAAPAHVFLAGRVPDFIKIDVEGAERQALLGCSECIRRRKPALQVALYHASADLFELPLLIHRMFPSYRLYLRKFPSVPCWDINLFALPPRTT